MKKGLSFALTLLLLLSLASFAFAQQATSYQLGDQMDDFTATLSDGSQVSLYGLLKEKKAVLINFWASWCGPCKREFPYMEQAYNEMADDIGIIALSCEKTDTDETVLALKQELGLSSLPMGLDSGNLAARFALDAYPTSVMVDRNGVICFRESRSVTDKNAFIRLFSTFTAQDYSQPMLLDGIPTATCTVEWPSTSAVGEALHVADDRITVQNPSDATAWPFVPAQDGSCVQAANGDAMETVARLSMSVKAEAGEALQYQYALSCPAVFDSLTVTVDGKQAKYYGGDVDWKSDYVTFDTSGEHAVEIVFKRGTSQVAEASAALRDALILSAKQVEELDAQAPKVPKTLAGVECDIEPAEGVVKPIIITESLPEKGESKQRLAIVTGGALTLRIQIGEDVDEHVAYFAEGTKAVLLADLPTDDKGFLYQTQVLEPADKTASPYTSFYACSSATDRENCFMKSYNCFASEADADTCIEMFKEMAASAGLTGYEVNWEYEDGSPKQAAADDAASAIPEGMAEYRIVVQDESGAPVSGAMIQLCDADTCQVAVTDDTGVVTHVAEAYPFEIHLLKAPDGYAADTETHVMPKEGGELVITLQKQ